MSVLNKMVEMPADFYGAEYKLVKLFIPLFLILALSYTSAQNKIYDSLGSAQKNISEYTSLREDKLTGSWWGLRNIFEDSGLNFDFTYKGEVFSNVYRGIEQRSAFLDNIDLTLSADLEKTLGLTGTNLFIYVLGNRGGAPNDFCGSLQGVSNIETIPAWKLYQFLIEKTFFNDQFSIKVGLYDLNSEFDTKETSGIFINPSHGIGPDFSQSGLNGPSIFPTTSMSLVLKYEFENGNYFQSAILDGVPGDPDNPLGTQVIWRKDDGLLLVSEFGLVNNYSDKLDSKVSIGAWYYTRDFEKYEFFNANELIASSGRNYGVYLNYEKLLGSLQSSEERNIYGFLRTGLANKYINPVDFYLGGGLKINGLFPDRKDDEFGIAFAYSHNSSIYRNNIAYLEGVTVKPYEWNFEITYLFKINDWCIIQPDIQYIINPTYCNEAEKALVLGSRILFFL